MTQLIVWMDLFLDQDCYGSSLDHLGDIRLMENKMRTVLMK